MKTILIALFVLLFNFSYAQLDINPIVNVKNGQLRGTFNVSTGIRSFKGIPYAKPPVGGLRWQAPQAPDNWTGVRHADHFSHMAMQKRVFSDMVFRADTMSEDCLYLNVWTSARGNKKLPVLIYFYGGGFVGGDGSESRYDGASLAQKGIVTVTINYRLGIFGFFSYPELTKESPKHASGNYGLLDQNAAIKWVKENIAAFGGDPSKITIAGESAGSIAVFAQMASPLSRNLIAGAIGESGAMIKPTLPAITLAEGEKNGLDFAQKNDKKSLADLRAIPAAELLDMASKPGVLHLAATIDGYFFTDDPVKVFEQSKQAHVPLLVGWNSAEIPYQALTGGDMPTPENYETKVKQQFGANADEVLKLYPGNTQEEVINSATALASDRFIAYSTWKWADLQEHTGGKPVYRYLFSCPRPMMVVQEKQDNKLPPAMVGASHASEIEFALGNLSYDKVYAWAPDDYKVSAVMEKYFANFIKTGDPNGGKLPKWIPLAKDRPGDYMNIDVITRLEKDNNRDRYLFLDSIYNR